MSFLTDERAMWFLTRSTGVVTLILLTASISLGVLATTRLSGRRWPRFVTQRLHRNLALICVVLVLAHAVAAIETGYLNLGPSDLLMPFAAPGRRFASSLGSVSLDLLVLATAAGLVRNRLGPLWWRVVHVGTYLAWPVTVVHGLGMGSDTSATWSVAVTTLCLALFLGAVLARLIGVFTERRRPGRPALMPRSAPMAEQAR